jgi:ANTAR domain/PAS fold
VSMEPVSPLDAGPLSAEPGAGKPRLVPSAAFTYWVGEDRWEWSDDLYRLHGFVRGEVVPTTELLLAHAHADDRESVMACFAATVTDGEPFVCRYRIIDADQRHHTVVAFASASGCADTGVRVIEGVMADVTEQLRGDIKEATTAAVDGVTASRTVIDEAKGVLMGRYGLSADEAFNVLRLLSSHTNCKVRTLAGQLIGLLTTNPVPIDERVVVKDLEGALREADEPPVESEQGSID